MAGDWNGDGRTDLGIFRGGTFLLGTLTDVIVCTPACVSRTLVVVEDGIAFGRAGDLPVAGDWDGDGKDDVQFGFGKFGDRAVAGHWTFP